MNLLIVMLLGGLWHGAAWTFIVWGAYHGLLLVLYHEASASWDLLPVLVQRSFMFLLVVVGWVIFRANSLSEAGTVLSAMAAPGAWSSWINLAPLLVVLAMLAIFVNIARPTGELRFDPSPARAALYAVMLAAAILLLRTGESPFLYYQF